MTATTTFNNENMKKIVYSTIFSFMMVLNVSYGQQADKALEDEIKKISKDKWDWMSDKDTSKLAPLFHEKSMFIHMGGSWGRQQELDVIGSGGIHYKKAEVYSVIVNRIGNTAILLNDIDLLAVVGGNEVVNPFMVTEVYVQDKGKWVLGSLTFSRLMRPVKLNQK